MGTKLISSLDKSKRWASQQQRAFAAFQKYPQTRLQVANTTGVPLQNVCRYVKGFRDAHAIYIVKIDRCPISGMKAEFLSTDKKYAPQAQLSMFQ